MNDPLRPLDKPGPRRAEPLQPDDPTAGSHVDTGDEDTDEWKAESLERSREQAKTAGENNERK